jgi:F-type H+-transporting ATPase subunit gamma
MAKARALDKRRKSIRNIRKITRTMELIATARYKKAMDRATAATAYTRRITQVVADLARAGLEVSHPLLAAHDKTEHATLLVLTANRGLCGGYNGSVFRSAVARNEELKQAFPNIEVEVAGKRGIAAAKFRKIHLAHAYTQFNDQPKFEEVEPIATRYLEAYITGKLDRLDVAYTKFLSSSKQQAVVETLLPLGSLEGAEESEKRGEKVAECFLDAAVSEQIARMVAMKSATENASEMIKQLSSSYNRARQSQITGEIMEIIGGVEALKG